MNPPSLKKLPSMIICFPLVSGCSIGGLVQGNVALTKSHESEVTAEVWYGVSEYGTNAPFPPSNQVQVVEKVFLARLRVGMMNGVGFGFRACFGFEGTPNFGVSLCTAPTIDFGARKVVPPEETPQFRPYIGVVNPDLGLSFTINTRPKHRKEFYKWLRIMPSVSLDTGYQLDPDGHFVLVPRAGISFSWQGKSSNEPYF